MEGYKICAIMKNEFLGGTTASQTSQNINSVFGSSVTTQQAVNLYRKLCHVVAQN